LTALTRSYFSGPRDRRAQRLSRRGGNFPRVLRLGAANRSHAYGPISDFSPTHFLDEWSHSRRQGPVVLPKCSSHWSPLGCLGSQVLLAADGRLHLCPYSPDEDQPLVVLCSHFRVRCVRRHLLRHLRLRGRRHAGAREKHGVRSGLSHVRRQPGNQPSHRGLSVPRVRGRPRRGAGLCRCHAGHLLHSVGCARVASREDEAGVLGGTHLLGAGRPLRSEYPAAGSRSAPPQQPWSYLGTCLPSLLPQSLRKVGQDSTVLLICITVFLSYLPEAGQYSSFFLYLRQVVGFTSETVAAFIAVVGILSILAQTAVLGVLVRSIGNKNTILPGLGFQILQLAWYGFGSQPWMMWAAGAVAAMSSITFPAISAIVSRNADPEQQGVVQGMITGIRGLCNGLGPALYGFVFYLFHVELNEMGTMENPGKDIKVNMANPTDESTIIPGPPFLFGACSVLMSLLVALFIPERSSLSVRPGSYHKHSNGAQNYSQGPKAGGADSKEPLLEDSV
ncbi:uncharacterized protein LOC108919904, partial [Scleropages formosus]|uniref:uncharacterized protein LOC108919904 n=1 Tax=Scleropages formosus TaxID=113540 RepID=UPI0010FAB146